MDVDVNVDVDADVDVDMNVHIHIQGVRASAKYAAQRVGGGATATAPDLRRNPALPVTTMLPPKAKQERYLKDHALYAPKTHES